MCVVDFVHVFGCFVHVFGCFVHACRVVVNVCGRPEEKAKVET